MSRSDDKFPKELVPSPSSRSHQKEAQQTGRIPTDPCTCQKPHKLGLINDELTRTQAKFFGYRTQYHSEYGRDSGIPYSREAQQTGRIPTDPCTCQKPHKLGLINDELTRTQAKFFGYRTQYHSEYGRDSGIPYSRPPPPRTHEATPDAVAWRNRKYDPPLQLVKPTRGTHDHDPDKGFHEWMRHMPGPGEYIWQPMDKHLFRKHTGRPRLHPPARINRLNPTNEKERWENIKVLDASGCLSHG